MNHIKKWKKTHRQRKKLRTVQIVLNGIDLIRFNEWRIRHSWSKDRAFKEVLLFIKKDYERLIKSSSDTNIPDTV